MSDVSRLEMLFINTVMWLDTWAPSYLLAGWLRLPVDRCVNVDYLSPVGRCHT